MWVRKTPGDVKTEDERNYRHRWSPIVPLVLSPFLGLGVLFYDQSKSWHSYLIGTLGMFVFVYVGRMILGDRVGDWLGDVPSGHNICPSCHKPQRPSETGCVVCSTKLEPLSDWKWTRDSKRKKRWPGH